MTTAEIGGTRALSTAGRELVRAAMSSRDSHTITGVTLDGRHIAAVIPSGPADRLPCRAELDALASHLMTRMSPAFKPDAPIGETDLLGRFLAEFLNYLGSDILAVAEAALTEANMHGTAARVRAIREAADGG
jgi:hypothetical protein